MSGYHYRYVPIPFSGDNPGLELELSINCKKCDPLTIILDRSAFPIGVENFYRTAISETVSIQEKSLPTRSYYKNNIRTYNHLQFTNKKVNNFISCINNDTIYDDAKFIYEDPGFYYSHHRKGLISLIPEVSLTSPPPSSRTSQHDATFGSSFLITLGACPYLDKTHVVIGKVTSNMHIIDAINECMSKQGRKQQSIIKIDNISPHKFYNKTSTIPQIRRNAY